MATKVASINLESFDLGARLSRGKSYARKKAYSRSYSARIPSPEIVTHTANYLKIDAY